MEDIFQLGPAKIHGNIFYWFYYPVHFKCGASLAVSLIQSRGKSPGAKTWDESRWYGWSMTAGLTPATLPFPPQTPHNSLLLSHRVENQQPNNVKVTLEFHSTPSTEMEGVNFLQILETTHFNQPTFAETYIKYFGKAKGKCRNWKKFIKKYH